MNVFPTKRNIDLGIRLFNQLPNGKLGNEVIRQFVEKNRGNSNLSIVATKVVLINSLYYTQIFAPLQVARHIHRLAMKNSLDKLISDGDARAIDLITYVKIAKKKKRFFSFASKYCHFHNPNKYPLIDSYVTNLLKKINGKEKRFDIDDEDFGKYEKFRQAVVTLRKKARLTYDFDKIDKYLWIYGQAISNNWRVVKNRNKLNREVKECFTKNKHLLNKLGNLR